MQSLKSAFNLNTEIAWDRDNIWEKLVAFSKTYPGFKQTDLAKKNGLPSLPCILSYYPEYKNFSDIKIALGLSLNYELWTKDKVIEACKNFLTYHSKITLKDLRKENGLPTSKVIYGYFGTMERFQEEIGSEKTKKQEFISKEKISITAKQIVANYGSNFDSRKIFFDIFPFSESLIIRRYGSFDEFVREENISILKTKKSKYTKQEIDESILCFLKNGNEIPTSAKQLSSLGLPSSSTILRFYDDWKEPFVMFSKMINFTS